MDSALALELVVQSPAFGRLTEALTSISHILLGLRHVKPAVTSNNTSLSFETPNKQKGWIEANV